MLVTHSCPAKSQAMSVVSVEAVKSFVPQIAIQVTAILWPVNTATISRVATSNPLVRLSLQAVYTEEKNKKKRKQLVRVKGDTM